LVTTLGGGGGSYAAGPSVAGTSTTDSVQVAAGTARLV
jgi:hypothetical protein